MAKKTNYFSHDSNARNDEKMLALRIKHGAEGYGIFFMLLERLREETSYECSKDYNVIAFDLRVDAGKLKSVIEDFGLFAFTDDGKCFYSESFKKRMELKDEKTETARNNANKRWNNATAKQTHKESDATALQPHVKSDALKESKVKESKERKEGEEKAIAFIPPTLSEVQAYFQTNGYSQDAGTKAFTYYDTGGWKDSSGKKVKNWKQKMQAVWFRPEHKIYTKPQLNF